jgi:hypothetical protein
MRSEQVSVMAKASISIGVDDATGQPAEGPRGPYITPDDDGSRPRQKRPSRAAPKHDRAQKRDAGTDADPARRRKGPVQP